MATRAPRRRPATGRTASIGRPPERAGRPPSAVEPPDRSIRLTAVAARKFGLMKTGDAARFLKTTTRTLLFYEEEGLLRPRRTVRRTRMYSQFDLSRAEIAIRLSRLGFPLKFIKQLALTRPAAGSGRESSHKLAKLIEKMRQELKARAATLKDLGDDLERADLLIRQCWTCPHRPTRQTCPHCPCELNLGRSALLHLTWDPDR